MRNLLIGSVVAVLVFAVMILSQAGRMSAFITGIQAYTYGYPLVLMNITHDVLTGYRGLPGHIAGDNVFNHTRAFPTPAATAVVAPNADTLYSIAWLDLREEPMVMHMPDTGGRWYMMQLLDAWTNTFDVVGKRTTGTGAGDFVIAGPQWQGTLPQGMKLLRSPTNRVWIIGRVLSNGPSDHANVHAMQAGMSLVPLSKLGTDYVRPEVRDASLPDLTTPPVRQVAALDASAFFSLMAEGLKTTPPHTDDVAMVEKLTSVGLVPGRGFDLRTLPEATQAGLAYAVQAMRVLFDLRNPGTQGKVEAGPVMGWLAAKANGFIDSRSAAPVNGWRMPLDIGRYGTNYALRAFVALAGLGANPPEDAVYPSIAKDEAGNPLDGQRRYVMHFAKDDLPPVDAFWSLTLYNTSRFFVANPINRYAIGDRDDLLFNADGSLDIFIQSNEPSGEVSRNWLPSATEPFNLTMRLYDPKERVLKRGWAPPVVRPID